MKSHFKSTMQKSRKRGLKHWQKCDGSSQWTLCVKRYVFNERLKTASDELWRITSGRLFHARGPATEKSQYPMLSVVSPAQQCCPMSSELAARYTHPWSSLNPSFKSWIMRCELVWHEFKWYPMWITYWPHLRQGSPRHIQLFCISIVFFVWLFGGIRFYFSISCHTLSLLYCISVQWIRARWLAVKMTYGSLLSTGSDSPRCIWPWCWNITGGASETARTGKYCKAFSSSSALCGSFDSLQNTLIFTSTAEQI